MDMLKLSAFLSEKRRNHVQFKVHIIHNIPQLFKHLYTKLPMLNKYGKIRYHALCIFQGVTSHKQHQSRIIGSQSFKFSKRSTYIQQIEMGSQIGRQGQLLNAILFKAFPYFQCFRIKFVIKIWRYNIFNGGIMNCVCQIYFSCSAFFWIFLTEDTDPFR